MKVTITINGLSRDYQGTYEELHVRDWNERMQNFLDDVQCYEEQPPDEIPGFEGTRAQLDALTIRK
jgi:hypothetical protein